MSSITVPHIQSVCLDPCCPPTDNTDTVSIGAPEPNYSDGVPMGERERGRGRERGREGERERERWDADD